MSAERAEIIREGNELFDRAWWRDVARDLEQFERWRAEERRALERFITGTALEIFRENDGAEVAE
ncbi:MAG: hypothetical protein H0U66_03135 [Gemmatimonadaceae bacterium]|nr:hypothetical protein [Gemmatimonadaceae bacterium]